MNYQKYNDRIERESQKISDMLKRKKNNDIFLLLFFQKIQRDEITKKFSQQFISGKI